MSLLKILYIFLGTLSLGIGILGIFVPGLPTTVFLLVTAGLYVRSSDRLYNKLITNRYLGKYILNYREKKGMELKQKIWAMIMMWSMILVSVIFFLEINSIRLLIILLGLVGTIVVLFVVRTVPGQD